MQFQTSGKLSHFTNSELLTHIKECVADERRATLVLIEYLEEAQTRRLYAALGYGSLWEFATQELKLSEGAAQRRISAMRLTRDVPEAKLALERGTLSLSNAAKVHSVRQAQKKKRIETERSGKPEEPEISKLTDGATMVREVEGLSQRECEKKLLKLAPEALPKERIRVISPEGARELKLVMSAEIHEKLERIKALLSHSMPNATYSELLDYLTTETLARLEKKAGIDPESLQKSADRIAAATIVEKENPKPSGVRVYLSVAIRRAVAARSGGQCEMVIEGRRCTSRHRLELDHRVPLALGGSNDHSNMRIVCKNHNLWLAQQSLHSSLRPSVGPW